MSNKTNDKRKAEEEPELDDEQAEEEEEEEEGESEGESEDESEDADDADEEEDEEDEEEDEEEDDHHGGHQEAAAQGDDEDPYWWTPHVVLAVLVLIGLLGFFGLFNKTLGFLAAKPASATVETTTTQAPAAAPQPMPQPRPNPAEQPMQPPQQREMFGAKHFLVMYKGSKRAPASITRTKEEAKARAEECLKKVKAGKKFEEVVGECSDEPNAAQRGGDLGNFPKGAMVPAFQEGVEKIKVGEVSGLVETDFGYHVILRTK